MRPGEGCGGVGVQAEDDLGLGRLDLLVRDKFHGGQGRTSDDDEGQRKEKQLFSAFHLFFLLYQTAMPAARKAAGIMTTASAVSMDDVPLLMVRYSVERLFAWMEMLLSEPPQSQLSQLRKKSSLPTETPALVASSSR